MFCCLGTTLSNVFVLLKRITQNIIKLILSASNALHLALATPEVVLVAQVPYGNSIISNANAGLFYRKLVVNVVASNLTILNNRVKIYVDV